MNTEKKLDALIDALGFEVKTINCRERVGLPIKSNEPASIKLARDCVWEFIGDGEYQIHREYIDYKLTKKEQPTFVPMEIQSKEWGCIVNYIANHTSDIEYGINDYGDLKPMLDFFNRNSV